MTNKLTPEQIEKAMECKSEEELLTLAKENGIELTQAEAKNYFAQLHPENGELADSELEAISGGCGDTGGCSHNFKLIVRTHMSLKYECEKCGKTKIEWIKRQC